MPEGELVEYLRFEDEGSPYKLTMTNNPIIGGRGHPRMMKQVFSLDTPINKTHLVISVSSNEIPRNVLWKVTLNEVTLTREFKPQTYVTLKEGVLATQVFDVSHIVKGPGKYELTITCESSEAITVEAIDVVGMVPMKGVRSETIYKAGCVAINPSETHEEILKFGGEGRGNLILVLTTPSRNASVDIELNNIKLMNIVGQVGTDEVTMHDISLEHENLLKIMHNPPNIQYFPKIVKLHSLLVYRSIGHGPKIVIEEAELREDNKLYVKLANTGDAIAERVILVVISTGNILVRDIINEVKPLDVVEKEYSISPKKLSQVAIVRGIYRGVSGQKMAEAKVKVKTT